MRRVYRPAQTDQYDAYSRSANAKPENAAGVTGCTPPRRHPTTVRPCRQSSAPGGAAAWSRRPACGSDVGYAGEVGERGSWIPMRDPWSSPSTLVYAAAMRIATRARELAERDGTMLLFAGALMAYALTRLLWLERLPISF